MSVIVCSAVSVSATRSRRPVGESAPYCVQLLDVPLEIRIRFKQLFVVVVINKSPKRSKSGAQWIGFVESPLLTCNCPDDRYFCEPVEMAVCCCLGDSGLSCNVLCWPGLIEGLDDWAHSVEGRRVLFLCLHAASCGVHTTDSAFWSNKVIPNPMM